MVITSFQDKPTGVSTEFSNSRYLYKILYNEEDDYFYFKTVNVNASNRDGRLVQINKNKSSGALTLKSLRVTRF